MIDETRHNLNRSAFLMLFFDIVFNCVTILGGMVESIGGSRVGANVTGWVDICADVISCGVVLFAVNMTEMRRPLSSTYVLSIRVRSRQKMTPARFVFCLALFTVASCVGSVLSNGVEGICRALGSTADTANDIISRQAIVSVVSLVCSILIAPIVEEIVCRGILLSQLESCGSLFAIVTTSAMFALMHGDFSQGVSTFLMGLVLGWVAINYSVIWSIAIHMFNNAVLCYGAELLQLNMGDTVSNAVQIGCYVAAVVGVAVVLYLKRDQVRQRLEDGRSSVPHPYRSWLSPVFLIFAALCIVQAVGALFM